MANPTFDRITSVLSVVGVNGSSIPAKSVQFGFARIKNIESIGDGSTCNIIMDEIADKRYTLNANYATVCGYLKTFRSPKQQNATHDYTGLTFTGTPTGTKQVTFDKDAFTITDTEGDLAISDIAEGAGVFSLTPAGSVTGTVTAAFEYVDIPLTLTDSNTSVAHKIFSSQIIKVVIDGTAGTIYYKDKSGYNLIPIYYSTIATAVALINAGVNVS